MRTRPPTRTTSATRGASSWPLPRSLRWRRRSSSLTSRRPARTPAASRESRRSSRTCHGPVGPSSAISHDMRFVAETFDRVDRHACRQGRPRRRLRRRSSRRTRWPTLPVDLPRAAAGRPGRGAPRPRSDADGTSPHCSLGGAERGAVTVVVYAVGAVLVLGAVVAGVASRATLSQIVIVATVVAMIGVVVLLSRRAALQRALGEIRAGQSVVATGPIEPHRDDVAATDRRAAPPRLRAGRGDRHADRRPGADQDVGHDRRRLAGHDMGRSRAVPGAPRHPPVARRRRSVPRDGVPEGRRSTIRTCSRARSGRASPMPSPDTGRCSPNGRRARPGTRHTNAP